MNSCQLAYQWQQSSLSLNPMQQPKDNISAWFLEVKLSLTFFVCRLSYLTCVTFSITTGILSTSTAPSSTICMLMTGKNDRKKSVIHPSKIEFTEKKKKKPKVAFRNKH